MHYLSAMQNYGLEYDKEKAINFMGYLNANWTGDLNELRLTSIYLYVEWLLVGDVKSKPMLHYLQLKWNIWHGKCSIGGYMKVTSPMQS